MLHRSVWFSIFLVGCSSGYPQLLEAGHYGRACVVTAKTEEHRVLARKHFGSLLSVSVRLISDDDFEKEFGVRPAAEARFAELTWRRGPPRLADPLRISASLRGEDEKSVPFEAVDVMNADAVFPTPDTLAFEKVPPTYVSAPFVPKTPRPKLEYRSRRSNALEKGFDAAVNILSAGFLSSKRAKSSLTAKSLRALRKWKEDNAAPHAAHLEEQKKLRAAHEAHRQRIIAQNKERSRRVADLPASRRAARAKLSKLDCSTLAYEAECRQVALVPKVKGELRLRAVTQAEFEETGCRMTTISSAPWNPTGSPSKLDIEHISSSACCQ